MNKVFEFWLGKRGDYYYMVFVVNDTYNVLYRYNVNKDSYEKYVEFKNKLLTKQEKELKKLHNPKFDTIHLEFLDKIKEII